MPTRKSVQQIWRDRGSGLIVPEGIVSDLSHSSSQTYLQIKEKALALEQLYSDSNIPLPPNCDLSVLITKAKDLSDRWLMNKVDELSMELLFRAVHLDRVADAVLLLQSVPDSTKYLRALTAGSLNLFERQQSNAKDIFWELELWSILKRRSFDTTISEPPDIVVAFEDSRIGIACKKLYSERNVEKVLSDGVAQIEAGFDFGIVAINLDDLVPPNQILRVPTQEAMGEFINDLNARFLQSHKRHLRKYLASGRLLSALVSTSVLADVHRGRPRFNNARQSTIWAIPGLPPEKDRQLQRFYDRLMG